MVGVALAGGSVAALGGAGGSVAQGEGDALGLGVEAAGAAEVEDLGLPAEHGGDDPGPAGQAAGLGGGDDAAGGQPGRLEPTHQGVEGHRDHDGGGHAAAGGGSLSAG